MAECDMYIQLHTDTHSPAYKTAQVAGRRSGRHTYCLQDRTGGRSPVRETHLLPTRHRWQVAGQGDTPTAYKTAQVAGRRSGRHTYCLQDTGGRSPVRETHINIALPTRPHRWQVAGQGDTIHIALPTRHRWQVAGQGDTHTHSPAYKTAQVAGRRSGRHTYT